MTKIFKALLEVTKTQGQKKAPKKLRTRVRAGDTVLVWKC